MAKATTAGAGAPKQFVYVLPLALASELHQAKLSELSNLGPSGIVANRLGEMLQQLQLIAARLHVDEVDDHYTADVAQLQLAANLHRRFAVGPEHRLAGVGRTGERTGVYVDDCERLGGLDDHVAAGGQVNPRLQRIANGRIDLEVVENILRFVVGFYQHRGVVGTQKGIYPVNRFRCIHHHANQVRAVEIS